MATHAGELRLAELRMIERMAEAMDDTEYVEQCQRWFDDGSRAMENKNYFGFSWNAAAFVSDSSTVVPMCPTFNECSQKFSA